MNELTVEQIANIIIASEERYYAMPVPERMMNKYMYIANCVYEGKQLSRPSQGNSSS